jgi:hypothetical protein
MPPDAEQFDPVALIEALAGAAVDFVVIGGVAGGSYGSAYATGDLDVAYARDRTNLEKLAAVLHDLAATLRGAPPDVPFLLDAKTLEHGANFTFLTRYDSLDILADPAGAPPYRQLRSAATVASIRGHDVHIASLDHLIAMKEAAGRPKDKLMATEYRVLSDAIRAPKTESPKAD